MAKMIFLRMLLSIARYCVEEARKWSAKMSYPPEFEAQAQGTVEELDWLTKQSRDFWFYKGRYL